MLREELKRYVELISLKLKETEAEQFVLALHRLRGGDPDKIAIVLSKGFKVFSTFYDLSKTEPAGFLKIMEALELNKFYAQSWWDKIIKTITVGKEGSPSELMELTGDLWNGRKIAEVLLPQLFSAIGFFDHIDKQTDEFAKAKFSVFIEEGENGVDVERIEKVLFSVRLIYENAVEIQSENVTPLKLVSLDVGSVFEFVFGGAGKIFEKIKTNINVIAGNIFFRAELKKHSNIVRIREALPLLLDVEERRRNGSLSNDNAMRLERSLLTSIDEFIDSGGTFNGMDRPNITPALLSGPDKQRLLEAPRDQSGQH